MILEEKNMADVSSGLAPVPLASVTKSDLSVSIAFTGLSGKQYIFKYK